jgi:hypothetical protein
VNLTAKKMGWDGLEEFIKKWDLWYEYHLFEAQRDIWLIDVYGCLWDLWLVYRL